MLYGFLREEMDLANCVLLLGNIYVWDCIHSDDKPSVRHYIQIFKNKYDKEKLVEKQKYQSLKNKRHVYGRHILCLNVVL